MGTLVYRSTKSEAVRRELADLQGHCTLLASRLIGPRLWFLAERNGIRWIGLTLIESRGDEVAVKHMDESMGPYHFDCPLAFIKKASPPAGSYAGPWREKVLAFHARRATDRAQRSQVRTGQRVRLASVVYVLQQSLGRRGWAVTRESDGVRMRMLARHLGQVEWLPAVNTAAAHRPPDTAGPPGPDHPPS